MATIKSYTDLEQSKVLAKILPLESADMNWHELPPIGFFARTFPYKLNNGATEGLFPCWSLAALLDVLSFPELCHNIEDGEDGWIVSCEKNDKGYLSYYKDNPVDACYEMILKLHELKML